MHTVHSAGGSINWQDARVELVKNIFIKTFFQQKMLFSECQLVKRIDFDQIPFKK